MKNCGVIDAHWWQTGVAGEVAQSFQYAVANCPVRSVFRLGITLHAEPGLGGWRWRRAKDMNNGNSGRRRMLRRFGIGSLVLLASCASSMAQGADPARQGAVRAHYANPILDTNFPDPAVLLAQDGYYYVYATQGEDGAIMRNIQVARSRDLVSWERLGDALPVKPSWASRTQDFWAALRAAGSTAPVRRSWGR